jgi:hypothetical protein
MLEVLPQEGYGHISAIAWPSTRANILMQFATNPWAQYRSGAAMSETVKYILSMLGDKSCLNALTGLGCTALYMAALNGNAAMVRTFLEFGCDPNLGVARTPLNAALEWLEDCSERERNAFSSTEPAAKKHAVRLMKNAKETVRLLQTYGAHDQSGLPMTFNTIQNGTFTMGSLARPEVRTLQ